MQTEQSLSIANPNPIHTSTLQKAALAAISVGVLMLLVAWASSSAAAILPPSVFLTISLGLVSVGTILFVREEYGNKPEGIYNNNTWFHSLSAKDALKGILISLTAWVLYFSYSENMPTLVICSLLQLCVAVWMGQKMSIEAGLKRMTLRGLGGWMLGIFLSGFYVVLYWYGDKMTNLVHLFDPLSKFFRNSPADQWFVYGSFYTLSIILMAYRFAMKYRHNRYQLIRTASVTFFQLGFAFLIPSFLKMMNEPEYYFTYFWPLKTDSLKPESIQWITQSSSHGWGWYFIGFSILMTVFGVPVLTYFYGKRWYCSWVCGCGGLAETVGDPFRQLSDKSLTAWKVERWMIHSVLVFVTLMTTLLWVNSAMQGKVLGDFSHGFSKTYGFLIGSVFSGVIGTGFYPILGSRGWCRFGCPQAAILGLFQRKKSKFRITTNGSQCISCGNCSTHCEMGIDVRSYAQKGQDIVRASCVGCGICAAVCPRGVLRLENGDLDIDERTEAVRAIHVKNGVLEIDNSFN